MADDIVVIDSEEEETVVDNGTSFVSSESAEVAEQAARDAKLWAEESERQALLAIGSAEDAAQAKADAVAAKEYAESAITDTNLITVATDLQSTPSNIKTVATNISNVNAVGGNISNVNAVAGNATNINAVNSNKTNIDTVAGISSNITTVAGISSNVTTVAGISSDVSTVAGIDSDVSTVSGISSDVSTVSSISSDVSSVASNSTNINKVATDINRVKLVADDISSVHTVAVDISNVIDVADNKTNIDTVAGISSNVTTVAGISANVTTVAGIASDVSAVNSNSTNINTVAGINSDVSTVASIASDVSAVSSNSSNINSVASDLTNINSVASDLTNINAVAADLTNIDNASSYASEAKQWAIGDPSEPTGGSAKYWASQAAQGQVQADWTEADSTSKAYIKNKPVNVLTNEATGSNAYSVGGTATGTLASSFGYYARASGVRSTALGEQAQVTGQYATAIGSSATAGNDYAIQIGYGTNTTTNTLYVGFRTDNSLLAKNWQLLNGATGYIPNARINMDSTPTSASTNTVTSGGVYTALSGKADASSLATVATSGSYADLSNKPDLSSYAVDADVVHLAGTETITGDKTFTGNLCKQITTLDSGGHRVQNTQVTKGTSPSTTVHGQFVFQDSTSLAQSGRIGGIETGYNTTGTIVTRVVAFEPVLNSTDKCSIEIVYDAYGNKYATAPASDVANSILTTISKTKAGNGGFKLGNGLIVNFGHISSGNWSSNAYDVTYSIPFTTYGRVAICRTSGATTANDGGDYYARNPTTTGFNAYRTVTNTASIDWVAIGY